MKKQMIKPLALGSVVALTASLAGTAMASENPFSATALKSGYEVSFAGEGSCGEARCGADKKKEGSCGDDKKAEGSCGGDKKAEGSCGGDKKAEGSCGDKKKEGSCGGDKKKEGSCGGDK